MLGVVPWLKLASSALRRSRGKPPKPPCRAIVVRSRRLSSRSPRCWRSSASCAMKTGPTAKRRRACRNIRSCVGRSLLIGSQTTPDYTTLYRCLRRIGEDELTRLLHETIRRMPPPPAGGTTVAVDATGLAPGAISTFCVNRVRDRGQGLTGRHWLKWVVVVDLPRRLILAQVAKPGPTNDGATLRPWLEQARRLAPIRCVLADAEFDSERNHTFIRQVVGADSIIPAKRGKKTWRLHGARAQMRADFPIAVVPGHPLPPARPDRIGLLCHQAQALGARRWALVSYTADTSLVARHCLQPLPPPFAPPGRLPLIIRMSTRPDSSWSCSASRTAFPFPGAIPLHWPCSAIRSARPPGRQ